MYLKKQLGFVLIYILISRQTFKSTVYGMRKINNTDQELFFKDDVHK